MITKDEWASLTGSPGWPKLKQFWRDQREAVKEGLARGRFEGAKLTEAILECELLRSHVEVDLPQIDRFYGVEAKQEENLDES